MEDARGEDNKEKERRMLAPKKKKDDAGENKKLRIVEREIWRKRWKGKQSIKLTNSIAVVFE